LIYEKETSANGRTCPTGGWNENSKEASEGPGKGQKKVARQRKCTRALDLWDQISILVFSHIGQA